MSLSHWRLVKTASLVRTSILLTIAHLNNLWLGPNWNALWGQALLCHKFTLESTFVAGGTLRGLTRIMPSTRNNTGISNKHDKRFWVTLKSWWFGLVDRITCCQIKAFSEKRIQIKTGSLSVLHLCVSLRANLNFFECVQFRHGYGSKKSFRILKLAQITWSFIEHVRHPFKNKNSVGSNFQKKL